MDAFNSVGTSTYKVFSYPSVLIFLSCFPAVQPISLNELIK